MTTTATEARTIIQPIIDEKNRCRDYVMHQARLTRAGQGSADTVRMLVRRARAHNAGARAMLRELRRLEATA